MSWLLTGQVILQVKALTETEEVSAVLSPTLRSLFDMKIFVDADPDVRLARRIRRDMESRGRDLAGILQQYEQFVKPSTETFVVPTKAYADVVVPRGAENEVAISLIANHINQLLDEEEVDALLKADGLKPQHEQHVA